MQSKCTYLYGARQPELDCYCITNDGTELTVCARTELVTLGMVTFESVTCVFIFWQKMDFPEMIIFLQKLPTDDWDANKIDLIVAQAYSWCQQWSVNHL